MEETGPDPDPGETTKAVFTLNYPRIQIPFEITSWVLLASFAKIGFHVYHKITVWVPELCLLISIGLIVGCSPPMLFSSICCHPLISLRCSGLLLLSSCGIPLALASACLPSARLRHLVCRILTCRRTSFLPPSSQAVLTVYEDISVHEQLYIVVFGECLFNDAVTVVSHVLMEVVEAGEVFLHIGHSFVVGLGGMLFGVPFGIVAAFTTHFTGKVREIEPLMIFLYSYLAYLIAEFSAISSIMWVGNSDLLLSSFFLGVVTIATEHEWNWCYILFTLLFALLWRGLGMGDHLWKEFPINRKFLIEAGHQFGLAYGGLRGAVSFALAFTLDSIGRKKLFITGTIVVIIFTVFIQGITIRPLLKLMNVRKTNRNMETINDEIHKRLMEHTVAGIEDLCGQWSHYYWKDKFMKFNNRIIRKILIRDNHPESSIVALYKKLELQNAILDNMSGEISAAPSLI
uniref:Solute carrier family 9 member 2 n=1 Tax=Sinocyclocheilus grahami TaxID=75366 RepID=A0A672K8B2_SINGR